MTSAINATLSWSKETTAGCRQMEVTDKTKRRRLGHLVYNLDPVSELTLLIEARNEP